MLIRIGGDYIGNNSPTSAMEAIVSVQDEKEFTYDVIASDADGDALYYRWGQHNEFFVKNGTGSTNEFVMPTGMTLETKDNKGVIKWDVRNSAVSTTTGDLWVAVIMVEDRLDN